MNNYLKKRNELSPFDESSSLKDLFQIPFFKADHILKTDIVENENSYTLIVDVPGCNKDDVKIQYEQGYLSIEVDQSSSHEVHQGNYIKKERSNGTYSRSFYIGTSIDSKQIDANYSNGTVKISFPKEKNTSKNSYIEIKEN